MKKKERKAIKKMIRKEAKKLSKEIIKQGSLTRSRELSHHRSVIQALGFDYGQIMQRLYEYQKINTQRVLSSKCLSATQPLAELKEFPDTLTKDEKKKLGKKLQKQLKTYIDSELFNMCGALVRHFEEQICQMCNNKTKDEDKEYHPSITKVGTLEDFEEFCKKVLHIPPEFILGPDYKAAFKNDSDDQSKDESSNKTDEESDKGEESENSDQNGNNKVTPEHVYDCGTENLVRVNVVDNTMLHKLENRWYREDPTEPLKVCHYDECKDLIGKEVWVRSPLTCDCEDGLCLVCAGVPLHDDSSNDDKDIGDEDIDSEEEPEDENIPAEHHEDNESIPVQHGDDGELY